MQRRAHERALVLEYARRREERERQNALRDVVVRRVRALAFREQLAFIDDPSRWKSLLCSRRAGKTSAAAIYLFLAALLHPGTNSLYLALTLKSARRLLWAWLKRINRDADIGARFNESRLEVELTNGSRIYLSGADANEDERNKLLGDEFVLAIIDEGASYRIDLRQLVRTHLRPATLKPRGTIAIIGTPDANGVRNFFYDVTDGPEQGWSRHGWDTAANPHMRVQWEEELEEIARVTPAFMETPDYEAMYLRRWPLHASNLVYRFHRDRSLVAEAPRSLEYFVIAVDLGWDNATSFSVAGWAASDDTHLYLVRSYKARGMDLGGVAAELATLQVSFPNAHLVVDGAARQSVEELRGRYSLPLIATEKADKITFIRMMNADLTTGTIKVVRGECTDLITEWTGQDEEGRGVHGARPLVWDARALKRVPPLRREDPTCANDSADSALYAWRYARNFLVQRTPAKDDQSDAAKVERLMAKLRRRGTGDEWDDDEAA